MNTNNTYLNILASYAYLHGSDGFISELFYNHRIGNANVMVDSGAFTLHNAQQERKWLTLDNYCAFCKEHENECEKYVMLDVVGNSEQSKRNYEEMVRRNLRPMFVLTMFDKDWSYFYDTMSVNRHCCVAGGVTTKGDWMTKRFQDAYMHSKEKALIHGLGYVTFPKIYQLPLYSVDSSSWNAGQRYGIIPYFNKGIKGISLSEVRKGKKLPKELCEIMDYYKITPKMFLDESNHHGQNSICDFMSCIAYVKFQRYSFRHGTRLFLAIANQNQLRHILFIDKYMNTTTYEEYEKNADSYQVTSTRLA